MNGKKAEPDVWQMALEQLSLQGQKSPHFGQVTGVEITGDRATLSVTNQNAIEVLQHRNGLIERTLAEVVGRPVAVDFVVVESELPEPETVDTSQDRPKLRYTSKMLMNEPSIPVSPTLASWVGLNECIFLQQLHFWMNVPKMGKEYDGRKWLRNNNDEWLDNFPFWDLGTMRRAINNLRKDGLILSSSKLNRMRIDRTLWYTIDYDVLDNLDGPVKRIEEKRATRSKAGSKGGRPKNQNG